MGVQDVGYINMADPSHHCPSKWTLISSPVRACGRSSLETLQGGNFHLKVGGAKSSGNAGDPMLGVAVSGGSRIYKRGGGHKIINACCLYDHTFII